MAATQKFEVTLTTADYYVFRTLCENQYALKAFLERAASVMKPGESLVYRVISEDQVEAA